jgi:hypothetical protein
VLRDLPRLKIELLRVTKSRRYTPYLFHYRFSHVSALPSCTDQSIVVTVSPPDEERTGDVRDIQIIRSSYRNSYRLSRLRLHDKHSLTHLIVDHFCGVGGGPLAPSELNICGCSAARVPPSGLISSSRANPRQTHFVCRLSAS